MNRMRKIILERQDKTKAERSYRFRREVRLARWKVTKDYTYQKSLARECFVKLLCEHCDGEQRKKLLTEYDECFKKEDPIVEAVVQLDQNLILCEWSTN